MTQKFNEDLLSQKMTELWEAALQEKIDSYTEDDHEQYLDECLDAVQIGNLEYSAGCVLREVDPIAFRCDMADNEDRLKEDFESEYSEDDFRDEALEALDMEDEE